MADYVTTGQVARKLRISVSTLKRWLAEPDLPIDKRRNCNGWRLFTDKEIETLKKYKRQLKRNGKRFNDTTLVPIVNAQQNAVQTAEAALHA
jgi:DNA-binding transcriptional MerR regulator